MTVSAPDGAAIFRRRRTLRNSHADEEEAAMGMLFREQVEFAVGHRVAVHAEFPSWAIQVQNPLPAAPSALHSVLT